DDKSPVASFLEKRGEGIHHISLEVDDLDATLERLKKMNVQLIDKDPRGGAGGRRIAFIHPHSTGGVLVELCEALPEG
ncbi:MAG: VOC family protein, partial [Acidobacteriota bacterium]